MERVEYDPEIDPSIREEREAAERDYELSARIRLEIERYVADNDLVPRAEAKPETQQEQEPTPAPWDEEPAAENETQVATRRREKEARRREKTEAQNASREAKRTQRAARATGRKKAVQSVFTGSILGSEWARRMLPYMLGVVTVLVLYIAYSFHVQTLHLERQKLEREVRELGIKAVERTAERERMTRRSAIVERLHEKGIPLEEFPDPVKKIER
jgi:type IV secretory pathway VirB10-like protein